MASSVDTTPASDDTMPTSVDSMPTSVDTSTHHPSQSGSSGPNLNAGLDPKQSAFNNNNNKNTDALSTSFQSKMYLLQSPSGLQALLVDGSGHEYCSKTLSRNIFTNHNPTSTDFSKVFGSGPDKSRDWIRYRTFFPTRLPSHLGDIGSESSSSSFATSATTTSTSAIREEDRSDLNRRRANHINENSSGDYQRDHQLPIRTSERGAPPAPAPRPRSAPVQNVANDGIIFRLRESLGVVASHLWIIIRMVGMWYVLAGRVFPSLSEFGKAMGSLIFGTLVYIAYLAGYLDVARDRVRAFLEQQFQIRPRAAVQGAPNGPSPSEGQATGVSRNNSTSPNTEHGSLVNRHNSGSTSVDRAGNNGPRNGSNEGSGTNANINNNINRDVNVSRLTPNHLARRLINATERTHSQHRSMHFLNTFERSVFLFFASLLPGLGERLATEIHDREN